MIRPGVVVFDVNETLLDLSPLDARLVEAVGAPPVTGEWFARLLHGSLVANALDLYRTFDRIGRDALVAMATRRGVGLDDDIAEALIAGLTDLRPYPDVRPGLETIASSGLRAAVLTNGSESMAEAQIDNSGFGHLIATVISVDAVARFKPDPAPYLHAADALDVPIGEMMMVAAHDWDVAGAIRAGARGAFLRRDGRRWSLPLIEPDLTVGDVGDLAAVLVAATR